MKKFIGGESFQNIFHTLITQTEKLYNKNYIKNPNVAGVLIAESLLADNQ